MRQRTQEPARLELLATMREGADLRRARDEDTDRRICAAVQSDDDRELTLLVLCRRFGVGDRRIKSVLKAAGLEVPHWTALSARRRRRA